MKKVFVIGIGAGNPDYLTVQAIRAMNEVDVFFILDKGEAKAELVEIRKIICERYIERPSYRFVEVSSPPRDDDGGYEAGVLSWHAKRADIFSSLIASELKDGEVGAFLVWGDPSLYDSTLRIIDRVVADTKHVFDYEVVPGITSVQALAARHRISLNGIGQSIEITTGRRLRDNLAADARNAVVMLDDGTALKSLADKDFEIFWGAYLGTPDEILISGKLGERIGEIERVRAEARARKGWIMDTYLLRRSSDE